MTSRNYSRLISRFQRILNKTTIIEKAPGGIFDSSNKEILAELKAIDEDTKSFLADEVNIEHEKGKIRALRDAIRILLQAKRVTRHVMEKYSAAK